MDPRALRNRLIEARWFFFDLDDTLHSFRKASASAITSTLQLVLTQHPNSTFSLPNLHTSYNHVLKSRTQAAFIDGNTSHQYREDRFRMLLVGYGVQVTEPEMRALLDCYEKTLMANLEPKADALTEGPQDAQERTIMALGLAPFVDYLATTNKFDVAKTNGLFPRVLQTLGVRGEEVVMVGDLLGQGSSACTGSGSVLRVV